MEVLARQAAVLELAARQHDVVAAWQLRSLGVGRSLVRRRIAAGAWTRLLPGVYALRPPSSRLTHDAWCSAAVLSAPQPSALSHEAAARRWGAWDRGPEVVHVSAPSCREDAQVGGVRIRFHRAGLLESHELVDHGGIVTTSFARTVVDLAAHLTAHQLAHVLYRGDFLGLLDLVEVLLQIERRHGWPWSRVARTAVELYRSGSAGTRSATEDRFLDSWLARGLPEPVVNNPASVGLAGVETDFAWPERRLVAEIDGRRSHGRPNDALRDAVRDAALAADGWRVIRIPGEDVWSGLDASIELVRAAW